MNESTSFLGFMTFDLWLAVAVAYVLAATVVASLCAYVAEEKGRAISSWFFLGFFFGIFALIAIAGTPSREACHRDRVAVEDRLKAERDDPENWTGRGGTQ
jgi:hypothetical protein